MDFTTIDIITVIDIFLLLLIGIGPKIALVPFLELTAKLDDEVKGRVVRKMLTTASVTAVLLIVFGGLLTRLLHFSTGALAIAGGFILLNPAGIVVLVTLSAEAGSFGLLAIVIVLVALVVGIDVVVFRLAKQVSAHLDESRMLVTEKVFGFLLAALAVQLALDGLADLGVIHLIGH